MALGKKIFDITYKNWAKGMSTSDDLPDAGFSPLSDAVNLITQPGVMYQPAQPTDSSTNLLGEIIASCEDPTGNAARLFVSSRSGTSPSDSQAGRFYSMATTAVLTLRGSVDNSAVYVQGKTDMIGYKGEVYVTTATTIVRWQQPATFNTSFFSFNSATSPHPAIVFEDNAFYGDGNLLLRQDTAGVAPSTILTLPAGQIIVTLGIDPGSGKMLISLINQNNISNTINSQPFVGYYDGFSNKLLKIVQVDAMVTAFPFTEGQLYAAYGQNLGLWNGAGITFLRQFDIDFDNTQLLYKHHFASAQSTLYFIEKTRVIAHGPVRQGGEKVFYPAYKNNINANNLTNISYIGSLVSSTKYYLGLSFADAKFYYWGINDISTSNSQVFYTDSIEFDNEYWIYWIRIVWKNQVNTNVDPGSIRFYDQDGIVNIGSNSLQDLKNTSGAPSAIKDILNVDIRVKQFQVELLLDTVNPGVRRIIVYGDIANKPN